MHCHVLPVHMHSLLLHTVAFACALLLSSALAQPRVILISVDGLHHSDLEWAIKAVPSGNLAIMRKNCVMFKTVSRSSGFELSGLLALTSGASPKLTGVYDYVGFDRRLWPPGTACTPEFGPQAPQGTAVQFDESIINATGPAVGSVSIDADMLPLNSMCQPVWPHSYVRCNNIFEVIKSKGMSTAWADVHPSAEMLHGPSGSGVDQLYIQAVQPPPAGSKYYLVKHAQDSDRLLTDALVNWIQGADWTGRVPTKPPNFMGCSYSSLSTTQQALKHGGYLWDGATPSKRLGDSIAFIDGQIGRIMEALRKDDVLRTSSVVITAKHGFVQKRNIAFQIPATETNDESDGETDGVSDPTDGEEAKLTHVNMTMVEWLELKNIKVAHVVHGLGDATLIYLAKPQQTSAAIEILMDSSDVFQIDSIKGGEDLKDSDWVGVPGFDSRAADILVMSFLEQDDHPREESVGLLIWNQAIPRPATYKLGVPITNVAPTILKLLSIPAKTLESTSKEHARPLPGF